MKNITKILAAGTAMLLTMNLANFAAAAEIEKCYGLPQQQKAKADPDAVPCCRKGKKSGDVSSRRQLPPNQDEARTGIDPDDDPRLPGEPKAKKLATETDFPIRNPDSDVAKSANKNKLMAEEEPPSGWMGDGMGHAKKTDGKLAQIILPPEEETAYTEVPKGACAKQGGVVKP